MLSVVKMPLKGKAEDCALNSHGNCTVDHGKSCVFEFLWEPCLNQRGVQTEFFIAASRT